MSTRTHFLPFVPFLIVSVVHVVVLVGRFPVHDLALYTKALIVPTLAGAAFWLLRRTAASLIARAALAAALVLAWVGDLMVGMPGAGFLIGLASFLGALVAYTIVVVRFAAPSRPRVWSVAYGVWLVGMLSVLVPHVGGLAGPIILYGLAVGTLAVVVTGAGPRIAIGAAVFFASDTVLALKLFLPGFAEAAWQVDAVIMVLYTVGQGLLVAGIVDRVARGDGTPIDARARRGSDGRLAP